MSHDDDAEKFAGALRESLAILNNTKVTNWERKQAASLVIATALGDRELELAENRKKIVVSRGGWAQAFASGEAG